MIISMFFLVSLLIFLILFLIFFIFMILGSFSAAPFVPSSMGNIDGILRYAKLKKNQKFVDLGSGDGRLVLKAVEQYGVLGIGVEMNPFLVWYSRLWAKLRRQDRVVYICGSLFDYPLSQCDVIYFFLLPKTMKKMVPRIRSECRKGTLIISHGFEAHGLKKFHQIEEGRFWTYFYRI